MEVIVNIEVLKQDEEDWHITSKYVRKEKFNIMKSKKINIYIILIIAIIAIIGILIFTVYELNVNKKTDNEEPKINETTVDYYTLEDELAVENINAEKTIIYEELLKYGEYDINPEYIHKNILYGTYISKELMNIILLTKGVWSYNIILMIHEFGIYI